MRLLLVCLLAILPSIVEAQGSIGQGLTGTALRQHLRTTYTPTTILSYVSAREHMFETIDDLDGDNELVGVYTGTPFHAVSIPDHTVVNCEHTWPQSMFQGNGMKSDIHHLYPTFSVINSTRSNKPFGEINDQQVDDWCGPGNNRSASPPEENIDEYSESDSTHFEPREAHKGNVARSMLYFATIYELRNNKSGWQQWFEAQLPTLLAWHQQDAVDQAERDRTVAIAGVQGNPNPFVLDPTLAERVSGSGDASGPSDNDLEDSGGTSNQPSQSGAVAILALLPNPPGEDGGRERVVLGNSGDAPAALGGWLLRDAAGHELQLSGHSIESLSALVVQLDAGQLPLNNGGDTVELLDANGNVLDRVTYTESQASGNTFVAFE